MTEPDPGYSDRRIFLVIGDDPAAAEQARAAVAAVGGEVAAVVGFARGIDRLLDQARLDGILIETRNADPADLSASLTAIDAIARDRGVGLVTALSTDQIDLVWECLADGGSHLLCDPGVIDRVAAIAPLSVATRFHDVTRNEDERLRLLNAEVARFAETIARLSRDGDAATGVAAGLRETPLRFGAEAAAQPPAIDAAEVRNLIRARRLRANHFPAGLFADPAWDMLLDLFAAELEHRQVSVSSLCIAAAVPGTTALRWIGTLVEAGLFERRADRLDRRRAYVGLTELARSGLRRYFESVRRAGLTLAARVSPPARHAPRQRLRSPPSSPIGGGAGA